MMKLPKNEIPALTQWLDPAGIEIASEDHASESMGSDSIDRDPIDLW